MVFLIDNLSDFIMTGSDSLSLLCFLPKFSLITMYDFVIRGKKSTQLTNFTLG